jgi:ABC-2 type transport system permease protein
MSTLATRPAPKDPSAAVARLSAWRLEWLRLTRTPRLLALVGVYAFFGFLGPVLARYMRQLLEHTQSNLTITAGEPRPVDAMTNFVGEVNQTALVVAVVVAAGSLAFDSRRGVSTFLRTRTRTMRELLLPRYTISAAAVVTAYLVGTLAAWYETTLLIGSLPATDVLSGFLCGATYLMFAISVTAAAAAVARTVLGTVGIAIGILLVLPVLGSFSMLHDWLPSSLATAPVDLLGPAWLADYLPTFGVTGIAGAGLLLFTAHRLARREL